MVRPPVGCLVGERPLRPRHRRILSARRGRRGHHEVRVGSTSPRWSGRWKRRGTGTSGEVRGRAPEVAEEHRHELVGEERGDEVDGPLLGRATRSRGRGGRDAVGGAGAVAVGGEDVSSGVEDPLAVPGRGRALRAPRRSPSRNRAELTVARYRSGRGRASSEGPGGSGDPTWDEAELSVARGGRATRAGAAGSSTPPLRCRSTTSTGTAWVRSSSTPSVIDTLIYMRDVEGFTDRDLVGLVAHRTTLADPVIRRFLDLWRSEERVHSEVIDRYLRAYAAARARRPARAAAVAAEHRPDAGAGPHPRARAVRRASWPPPTWRGVRRTSC